MTAPVPMPRKLATAVALFGTAPCQLAVVVQLPVPIHWSGPAPDVSVNTIAPNIVSSVNDAVRPLTVHRDRKVTNRPVNVP